MECTRCRGEFTPRQFNQQTCQICSSKHNARDISRRERREAPNFIAVDGEGYNDPDGGHTYNILTVGTASIWAPDGGQLDFETIMEFLWNHCDPTATYVGFYLGYDFTQWTRTLPQLVAWQLWHKDGIASRRRTAVPHLPPFPVRWRDWQFDVLGNKRFKLRHRDAKTWMFINDVGPYFQTSFLKAIDPKSWDEPVCTLEEYDVVLAGKAGRGDVVTKGQWVAGLQGTVFYNAMENRILPRVCARLAVGLAAESIYLERDQWHGPGQAAQAWMKNIGVITSKEVQEHVPVPVLRAAQDSYYGGWFEIFAHGHLPGETYEYDINSAYPDAMQRLPCLIHGSWVSGERGTRYTLCNAWVRGSNSILGAMPCRTKKGEICRPHVVGGVYWEQELEAALAAGAVDTWTTKTMWGLQESNCNCNPYATSIPDIYARRLAVGKNTPHGKALKVIYNSAYGKSAQSVGSPRYANPIYASLITSLTRSKILDAIASHPTRSSSLVMVATDGVYFREPHTRLELSPQSLGAWDAKTRHNMLLFKPGVWWDEGARERIASGLDPMLKSRGISGADLAKSLDDIDAGFAVPHWWEHGWPQFNVTIRFPMVTARSAITRGDWGTAGGLSTVTSRIESSDATSKRLFVEGTSTVYNVGTDTGYSTPYAETFGMHYDEDEHPDAPDIISLIAPHLH